MIFIFFSPCIFQLLFGIFMQSKILVLRWIVHEIGDYYEDKCYKEHLFFGYLVGLGGIICCNSEMIHLSMPCNNVRKSSLISTPYPQLFTHRNRQTERGETANVPGEILHVLITFSCCDGIQWSLYRSFIGAYGYRRIRIPMLAALTLVPRF